MIDDRLYAAFKELGWIRIPEILDQYAEEAAKNNLSYTAFLDNLVAEESVSSFSRHCCSTNISSTLFLYAFSGYRAVACWPVCFRHVLKSKNLTKTYRERLFKTFHEITYR
jgi:hypothetical protein